MSEATDSSKYFNLTNFGLGASNEIDPESARKSANELQEKLFQKLGLENVLEPFTLQTAHSAMKGSKHGLGAVWKTIYNKAKAKGTALTSRKAKQVADYYKGEGQKIADKSPSAFNDYLADLQDNGFKNATLNAVDRGIKHTAARITHDDFIVGDGDKAGPITKEALDALDRKGPPQTRDELLNKVLDRYVDGKEPEDDSMNQSDGVFGQTYADAKGQLSDFDAGIFNWSDSDSAAPAPAPAPAPAQPVPAQPVPDSIEAEPVDESPALAMLRNVRNMVGEDATVRAQLASARPEPALPTELETMIPEKRARFLRPTNAPERIQPLITPETQLKQISASMDGVDTKNADIVMGQMNLLRPVPEDKPKFTPKLKEMINKELGSKAHLRRGASEMVSQVEAREKATYESQLSSIRATESARLGEGFTEGRGMLRSEIAGFAEPIEKTSSFLSRAFSSAKNRVSSLLSGSQRQLSGLDSLNSVGGDILEAPPASAFSNPFGAGEASGGSASDSSSVASVASATEGRRFIPQDPQRSGRPVRLPGMGGEGQGGGGFGGGRNPWSRPVVSADVNAPTQSGRDAMRARLDAFEKQLSSESDAESVKHQINGLTDKTREEQRAALFADTTESDIDEVAEAGLKLGRGAIEAGVGGFVAGGAQIIPAVEKILDPKSSADERNEAENQAAIGEGQGAGQAVGGQIVGAVKERVLGDGQYAGARVARSVSSDDSLTIAGSDYDEIGDGDASIVGSEVSGADALPPAVVPAVIDDGASVSSATTTGAVIGDGAVIGEGASDIADLATVEGIGAVVAPEISPLIALGDIGLFGLGLTGAILTNVLGNPTAPPVEHINHIVNVAQQFGS